MLKTNTILLAILASVLNSLGAMYLKKASSKFELKIKAVLNFQLLTGLFSYFLSAAIVVLLLKFNDMSLVYPLTALSYAFVAILSWKFLKEKVNIYKITAIALITLGVILVAIS